MRGLSLNECLFRLAPPILRLSATRPSERYCCSAPAVFPSVPFPWYVPVTMQPSTKEVLELLAGELSLENRRSAIGEYKFIVERGALSALLHYSRSVVVFRRLRLLFRRGCCRRSTWRCRFAGVRSRAIDSCRAFRP